MNKKVLHILGMVLTMVVVSGPSIATGLLQIGCPTWAHAISGLAALLALPIVRQMVPIDFGKGLAKGAGAATLVVGMLIFGGDTACKDAEQPSLALVGCLVSAAGSDIVDAISDPLTLIPAVIGQCGQVAATDVEALISGLEGALGADAGLAASPVSTPENFDPIRIAREKKVLAAAKAYLAGGAG